MHFTISNQTRDSFVCQFGKPMMNQHILLVPPFSESIQFSPKCASLLLSRLPRNASASDTAKELAGVTESASSVVVKLSVVSGRQHWQRVAVRFPWIIYRNRVCHAVYPDRPRSCANMRAVKQISRKRHMLVVFPYRDTSCFLASIPNSAPLSSLMLPGRPGPTPLQVANPTR